MRTTRWKPDTCGCILEYDWDETLPDDQRVHILARVAACADHLGETDQDVFDHVLKENQTKNRIIEIAKRHKSDAELRWSFTGKGTARKLQVELVGANLTVEERAALMADAGQLDKQVELV